MRKSLLIAAGLLMGGVNVWAQDVTRWDFTNWSEETVNNLKTDAATSTSSGWSDDEKNDGSNMDKTAGNCFWAAADTRPNADGYLTANGIVIKELEGLKFTGNLTTRNLAIAVNYPEIKNMGKYHGGAYLWLGGSNKKFITIPAVKGGSTIKIGVESHKINDKWSPETGTGDGGKGDARGVELYIGSTKITGPATPIEYQDQEWTVPGNVPVDIIVDNTNGCHIYYIEAEQDFISGAKANLQAVVDKAEKLKAEDYTADSFGKLITALEEAKKALEGEDIEAMIATQKALEAAINALVENIEMPDYGDLTEKKTYDFQALCMELGKGGPWTVNDGGKTNFKVGNAEMHFLGDYTDNGYTWDKRLAYEYNESKKEANGTLQFTMRNRNGAADSNCGMFAWNNEHKFSVLGLKDGYQVIISVGTGTVTFVSDNVEGVEAGAKVTSAQTYTISTTEEFTRLDLSMAGASLIWKIEIIPSNVEIVPTIKLDKSALTLEAGASATLKATVDPKTDVKWESSNTAVATVEGGKVTAVAAGTAEITCYWESEISDKRAEAKATITVVAPYVVDGELAKSYDFTAMGDVTLVKGEKAGSIYNEGNKKNNDVFYCTNEGLENIAVQEVLASNKGWSIVNGKGLFLASGAGRCAAIGGIKQGQIVEFFYTGDNFYTKNAGNEDNGIKKSVLFDEVIGHVVFEAEADGMVGFELDKGNYITVVNIYNPDEAVTVVDGIIAESGYSTFSSDYALDLSTIVGGKAYVVVKAEGNKATLVETTDKVPANTGLIIAGEGGTAFTINTTTEATTEPENNLLVAGNGTTIGGDDNNDYILNDGTFYRASAGTIAKGKAYLHIEGGSSARELSIVFGDATGISEVSAAAQSAEGVYNLSGQRVAAPTKGLYIVNGQKVIIK